MDNAWIKVTAHPEAFGVVRFTYEWDGPLTAPVIVDGRFSRELGKLPWPLHMIEWRFELDGGLYVRTDVRWWRITAARYALIKAWEWFTVRCVLTLYVWGLATREPGRIPSWRDIGWKR